MNIQMHDIKNLFLAGISSFPSAILAIETQTWIAIVSSIILPILFFAVGKAADVGVQIYFKRQAERKQLRQQTNQIMSDYKTETHRMKTDSDTRENQ